MSDAVIEAIAGATGAAFATLITYPISTLSTFQAVKKKKRAPEDQPPIPPLYRFLDSIYQLTAADGWKRLYDGLQPTLVGSVASRGIYFYCFSALKELLSDQGHGIGAIRSMGVAYVAGCMNVLLTNPIWVIATRMQCQRNGEKSVRLTIQQAYESSGLEWVLKGLAPSLVLVCNPAIQFMIYKILMRNQKRQSKHQKPSMTHVLFCSAISKLGATLATYPLVLVKSRLQAYESRSRQSYQNAIDAILTIYQEEGFAGFYNGLPAKCVQSLWFAILLMIVKEKMAALLSTLRKKQK